MRLIIVYIVVGVSLYFVLSEMLKFTKAVSGGSRQRLKDIQRFKERLSQFQPITWTSEEWDLLSQKVEFNETSRIFNALYEGAFYTIFNENIAHFIGKKFGKGFIFCVSTDKEEYVLNIDDRGEGHLTIGSEDPLPCNIVDGIFTIDQKTGKVVLEKEDRHDVIKNADTTLIEMSAEKSDEVSSRAIQHSLKKVNLKEDEVVPFLLLFSLIWQEFIALPDFKA